MIRDTQAAYIQRGFSLLETLISIAALSFISIFILEMYLSAANLSTRAKNVDLASIKAVTTIENVKQYSDLSSFLMAEADATQAEDGNIVINRFYDKAWELLPVEASLIEDFLVESEINNLRLLCAESENAYYHLRMVIAMSEAVNMGLYDLDAEVTDISRVSQGNQQELVSLSTKKYFTRGYGYDENDSGEQN